MRLRYSFLELGNGPIIQRLVSLCHVHRGGGECEATVDFSRKGIARPNRGKGEQWKDVIKIGRTHMQDATPLTPGQEWSGYAGMLADNLRRIEVHWLRQGVEDRPLCDGQRSHADGIRCHSRKIPGDTIMRFMKPR